MDDGTRIVMIMVGPSEVFYIPGDHMYLGNYQDLPGSKAQGFRVKGAEWRSHRIKGELRLKLRNTAKYVGMYDGVPMIITPDECLRKACVPIHIVTGGVIFLPRVITCFQNILDPGYFIPQDEAASVHLALVDFKYFVEQKEFARFIINDEVRFGSLEVLPTAPPVKRWPLLTGQTKGGDIWVLSPTVISVPRPERINCPNYVDWQNNGIIAGLWAARSFARILGSRIIVRAPRDAQRLSFLVSVCEQVETEIDR
jgi:hypothetical protein